MKRRPASVKSTTMESFSKWRLGSLNLRQHLIERLRRHPEVTAERVAERNNQDEYQRSGNRQHRGHCKVHGQAADAEERAKGNRQSTTDERHYPDDRRNGGLG